MGHVVSTNVNNNKLNDMVNNKLKFYYNSDTSNYYIKFPHSVVSFNLKK